MTRYQPGRAPTFAPCPIGRYVRWLTDYVNAGGKIERVYDYPHERVRMLIALRDFTTAEERGVAARDILVPEGVRHLSGKLGHCTLFLPHGKTAAQPPHSPFVAIYSDPEFTAVPGYEDAIHGERVRKIEQAARDARYEYEYGHRVQLRISDLSIYCETERPARTPAPVTERDDGQEQAASYLAKLAALQEQAADLHADQQAMPDPDALEVHRGIVIKAFVLGWDMGRQAGS